mmetsp:Transcript_23750/g.42046  ORF Transcript_23750/g.42046 Transcript_23750/m.42046 type:complete len:701 (+) Transcript_23750:236-2338(+)
MAVKDIQMDHSEDVYKTVEIFVKVTLLANVVYLILSPFVEVQSNFDLFAPPAIVVRFSYTVFLYVLLHRKTDPKLVSLLYSNFFQLVLARLALVETPDFFMIWYDCACLVHNFLEMRPFKHNLTHCLLLNFKHTIAWYYFCYYYNGKSIDNLASLLIQILSNILIIQTLASLCTHREVVSWRTVLSEMIAIKVQITQAVEAIPDGIIVVGSDFSIKLANCAAMKLVTFEDNFEFEYSKRSYESTKCSRLDQDISHFLESDSKEVTFGITKSKDLLIEWKGSVLSWENEKAAVLIVRDVTVLLQLEQAKHEAKLKNIMLRSVSHELKTPTNSLIHLISKAASNKNLPDTIVSDFDLASICCSQLLSVIDDMLDYSKHLQGTLTLFKFRFDVQETLAKCVNLFKYHSIQYEVDLKLLISPEAKRFIFNDAQRFSQIVMSILNSIFKKARKGSLQVMLSPLSSYQLGLSFICRNCGDIKDYLSNLVIPHDSEADSDYSMLGELSLGFQIASSLAEMLGEMPIEVNGDAEKAEVKIALTMNELEMTKSQSAFNELDFDEEKTLINCKKSFVRGSQELLNKQILVVDDNAFNRLVVSGMLEQMGLSCDEAEDGLQALEMIKNRSFDMYRVVILDYEMPVMDGPTTALKLKELLMQGVISTLPALVGHTAYTSYEDKQRCFEAGMLECLSKPVPFQEFSRCINKYI